MVPSFQRLFCNEEKGIWQSLKDENGIRDEVPYWGIDLPLRSEGTVPREENL